MELAVNLLSMMDLSPAELNPFTKVICGVK